MLAAVGALSVLTASLAAAQPLPLKILVDYAIADAAPPPVLRSALAILAPAMLVPSVKARPAVAATATSTARVGSSVGDSLSRLTGDTWSAYTVTNALFVAPVRHLLSLAAVGAAAFALDRRPALLTLAVAPLLAITTTLSADGLKQRARSKREAETRLLFFVHQTLSSIPMVQSFCAEGRNRRRFEQLAHRAVATSQGTGDVEPVRPLVTLHPQDEPPDRKTWISTTRILPGQGVFASQPAPLITASREETGLISRCGREASLRRPSG
jgi:ATP-binding cassette subfamily B protein/subfamily B ATP-binding cassette protein MsbA